MAFPSIRSAAVTNGTTADTTAGINLPATIKAGDTLWATFRCAVAGAVTWPAGWTEVTDESADAADDQNSMAWRKADGTEGATIDLGANGNGKFAAIVWSVQDAADPTLRAPEISTVATGTSAGEPNATTCTPTGGAKDYLWLTVYGMEGEQTGITAYPANYTVTNSQQFANSGTAGAVTTNVTVGGAARQLNAASEDAAIWDVAGTLDDWVAYTIAFHPAEVVTALLDRAAAAVAAAPAYIPKKASAGLAVLTLAVNLLQTTLAPPPPAEPVYYTQQTTLISAPAQAPPWSAPNLLVSTLATVEEVAAPFAPPDWPLPASPRPSALTWSQERKAYYEDEPAFAQRDWPLPLRARPLALTHLQARPPYYADASPFNQYDWPLPQRALVPALTWVQTRPAFAVDESPVGQATQASPAPRRADAPTWTVNLLQSTLTPAGEVAAPFAPPVPENPALQRSSALTWVVNLLQSTLAPAVVAEEPVYYTQQTTLLAAPVPPPRWLAPNLLLSTLAAVEAAPTPVIPPDWPNPPRKAHPVGHRTFLQYYVLDQNAPFVQTDWRVPRRAAPSTQTWSQNLLQSTLAPGEVAAPFTPPAWALPARQGASALSWLQARPQYYVDTPAFSQTNWPNPAPRRQPPPTWLYAFDPTTPIPRTDSWPNPAQRPAPGQSWVVNLLQSTLTPSEAAPFAPVVWANPAGRPAPALTWLQARPIFAVDAPNFPQRSWPNPAPRRQPGHTWIVNLLESTLRPAAELAAEPGTYTITGFGVVFEVSFPAADPGITDAWSGVTGIRPAFRPFSHDGWNY